MKKRIIAGMAFAACLALCAAVWPQAEPVEKTPATPTPTDITAAQPKVPEVPEIEEIIMPEEEKTEAAEPEQAEEVTPAPEPPQTLTPSVSEVQAFPDQDVTPLQKSEPAPAPSDSALDSMVYVPGFGWLESQGPNHRDYAEDMYENGNKIGIMG